MAGIQRTPGMVLSKWSLHKAERRLEFTQCKLLEPSGSQEGRATERTLEDLCKEDLGVSALGRISCRRSKEAGTTFYNTT